MKRFRLHICSCIIVILLFIITLGGCSLLGVSKEFSVTPADGFQTEYVVGDEISLDKLKVVYDGKTLDFSEYELVKQATNDVALPGQLMYTEDTYVIKYNGNTSKESITVRFYQPLTKLELIRADGGLAEYYAGDDFVLDDWRVKAYYSDDKSVSVPLKSEMLGGLNGAMLAAGEYTLSISLLNVWTLNVDKKTQSKPELTVGYTDTTATARRTDGAEYKINDGSWTADYIFSGLSPNTDYTVYCRMAETDKLYASDVAVFSFTTLKSERVNTTAEIYDVTHNSFKVKYVDGLKVSAGTLQFTEGAGYYMFTGAAPNTTYKLTYWIASDATH